MIEIVGSGHSWHVVQGRDILARAESFDQICLAQDRILRAKRLRTRACLCCETPFQSTGPHHRLCDPCRALG